jgi:hypothetical protein
MRLILRLKESLLPEKLSCSERSRFVLVCFPSRYYDFPAAGGERHGNLCPQQKLISLERISVLQGEKMARLNEGYTQILRARNESGQAVRMMEVGLLADAGSAVKIINSEIEQGNKALDSVIKAGVDDEQGAALLAQVAKSYSVYLDQGIKPMQAALNQQSADAYYDLLENKLVPVSRQFDNDIQAFLSWGENRGKAEVSAVSRAKFCDDADCRRCAGGGGHYRAGLAGAAPYATETAGCIDCATRTRCRRRPGIGERQYHQ